MTTSKILIRGLLTPLFALFVSWFWTGVGTITPAEAAIKEIARLTAFTGEVLVRSRLKWTQVQEVDHRLITNDKVVTKRGRAEITFSDGSLLKLDLDTNLRITEKKVEKGLVTKRLVVERQVRVLLGKVWFDIKPVVDVETGFKAPTMVAAIRGTTGGINVDTTGVCTWVVGHEMNPFVALFAMP